jgi:hypothetical protein
MGLNSFPDGWIDGSMPHFGDQAAFYSATCCDAMWKLSEKPDFWPVLPFPKVKTSVTPV